MARWFVLLPSLWGCWLNMLLWRVIPRLFSYCAVWQMLTATLTCNDFCNCCEWQRLWPCCAGWTIFGVQNCLVQRGFHFLCYSQLSLFGHFVFFKPPKIFCSNLSGLFLPIDWSVFFSLIVSSGTDYIFQSFYLPPVFVISLLSAGFLLVHQPQCVLSPYRHPHSFSPEGVSTSLCSFCLP